MAGRTFEHNGAAQVFRAKASQTQGRSLQSFLASLSVSAIIFVGELVLFFLFRRKWPQIYHPESFRDEDVCRISQSEIISRCGLDTYLFLRYLKTLLIIFGPLAAIILPVLIPLNLIGGSNSGGGIHGLDTLSWGNISPNHTVRYWAHLSMALVVIVWISYIIGHEVHNYTKVRHRRLQSVERFKNAAGTTILVTDIPCSFLEESHLRLLYSVFPGGVKHVSIVRDLGKLRQKINERQRVVTFLEKAETQMIIKIQKLHTAGQSVSELVQLTRPLSWPPALNRHWLPALPWLTKKVDTIQNCRTRLKILNKDIRNNQKDQAAFPEYTSAIIQFNKSSGAFMASQSVLHTVPHSMTATLIEDPSHIIWKNLTLNWPARYFRKWLLTCLSVVMISLCTVPVAFTGFLSQLSYTSTIFTRLVWLEKLPMWVLSAIQGVLPPAILAVTMAIAPVLLHYLVVAQGRISYADAELALQDYYFAFLFLQVFIVVSVSSSAATVLSSLRYDFVSFAALLALNLPKAANYFLSYIILQAFSVSAGALLQAGRLLRFAATSFYGNTPRGVWEAIQKPQIRWGTFFPIYTNLAVITIIYSVVTPLILVVSILAFYSFWAVQRYNVLHVAAFNTDTGGLTYIKALFQLFLGLYSMELYLTGLFFLVRDENNRVVCTAQGLIMILAGLLTATYHVLLKRAYEPLINTVPVMLSSGTIGSVPVSHSRQVAQRKWVAKIRERATRLHQTILELIEEDISLLRDHEQAEALAAGTKAITIRDEALSAQQPTVWLPRDNLGVSNFEIEQTREVSPRILISDEDFGLGTDGRIKCNRNPFTKEKGITEGGSGNVRSKTQA